MRQHVFLDEPIMKQCEECGRGMEEASHGRANQHGFSGSVEQSLINHISAECGSYAAGLVYGIPWVCRINTFKSVADLGKCTEVRTLGRLDYDLIVRRDDPTEHGRYRAIYVLVIGKWPNPWFWVCGSILGTKAVARDLRPLNNDREWVYRVPQDELTPPPSYPF